MMYAIFKVGDKIGGNCNGYFDENYDNKICVMVSNKYAVFENEKGEGFLLDYSEGLNAEAKGDDWEWEE